MRPPRRKDLPPINESIFVGREGPLALVDGILETLWAKNLRILVFHGIGGQGKTALCRHLMERPAPKALRRALLDLHGRVKTDPDLLMVWVRNAFAQAGVATPVFDVALAVTWQATRPEEGFPNLVRPWLAKSRDALADVAPEAVQSLREAVEDTVETIPGLGILITKASRWAIDKTRLAYLERARPYLKDLYRDGVPKKANELSDLLPWFLAQDLNRHGADHPGDQRMLLIDEYERVFDEGGASPAYRENDFDRHLRTLLAECEGLLAIFFTRERLPWENHPHWRDLLKDAHHDLEDLPAKDADTWLQEVPIDDPALRAAMIDGARREATEDATVYPLMLNLQVEHWRHLTGQGDPIPPDTFHVAADTFEVRHLKLIKRVLRDYGDAMQDTLQRLSVANRFDRAAFDHVVDTFKTGLPADRFDHLADLSFVTRHDDGYLSLHWAMTEAIRANLPEAMRTSSIEALLAHYTDRATVDSSLDVSDATIAALSEAIYLRRQMGAEGFVDWLSPLAFPISNAARYAVDEQIWQSSLHFVEDALGLDHQDTATSYNNVAYNLNAQGRAGEAEPLYRKALEISERVLGPDHSDTAASYNNVASNLNAQGRPGEAERLFRKALEISERVLGPDHPSTATSYNNVASNLNAQGRHGEAEPLFRKALEIRERVLGPDHPSMAASYNNVASNLDDQGRPGEAEPLYRKALEIRERVLGPDHPSTATSTNNVAYNLNAQGRPGEAGP
ncbi:MAG: ATP-binding protein, partial [Rhodobacterales bacterium]|nr:ATP-binding protein [Rhodobacterales bacterium]